MFRHEERTWSLERSDSFLSDSPGMMSSSVGTSKCSSPACMEARARRAAHCGYSDSHRPGLQYGDSFDSLGDSPHSDRCGAACRGCLRLFVVAVAFRLPRSHRRSPSVRLLLGWHSHTNLHVIVGLLLTCLISESMYLHLVSLIVLHSRSQGASLCPDSLWLKGEDSPWKSGQLKFSLQHERTRS